MASKANYFKIGLFVIFAVAAAVVFAVILGLGSFGSQKIRFETYIDESVQGLTVGSPVYHRGVKIGNVEEIAFVASKYDLEEDFFNFNRYVLVVIAAEKGAIGTYGEKTAKGLLEKLIKSGLRVQLTSQVLTGMSYLEVDYFNPEEHPPLKFPWEPHNKYIPSAKSVLNTFTETIDKTLKKIGDVDFTTIAQNLDSLLVQLNTVMADANISELSGKTITLIDDLMVTNKRVKELLAKADSSLDQANIKELSEKTEKLLDDIDTFAIEANSIIGDLKDTNRLVQEVLKPGSDSQTTLPELMNSLERLTVDIDDALKDNRTDIDSIINKMDNVSTNLMKFSDELKRDPGILLFSEPPAPSEVVK